MTSSNKKTMEWLLSHDNLKKCRELTPREKEIVVLIWSGYSIRDISIILKISTRTIEFHKYNIMNKYKTVNIVQMLRVALAKKEICGA